MKIEIDSGYGNWRRRVVPLDEAIPRADECFKPEPDASWHPADKPSVFLGQLTCWWGSDVGGWPVKIPPCLGGWSWAWWSWLPCPSSPCCSSSRSHCSPVSMSPWCGGTWFAGRSWRASTLSVPRRRNNLLTIVAMITTRFGIIPHRQCKSG